MINKYIDAKVYKISDLTNHYQNNISYKEYGDAKQNKDLYKR